MTQFIPVSKIYSVVEVVEEDLELLHGYILAPIRSGSIVYDGLGGKFKVIKKVEEDFRKTLFIERVK